MCKSLENDLDEVILDIDSWHVGMLDSDAFDCNNVQIFK